MNDQKTIIGHGHARIAAPTMPGASSGGRENGQLSELFTTAEAAKWAKLSESYFHKARLTGTGPRFCRLAGKAIRYRREDLEAWADETAANSTSEYS